LLNGVIEKLYQNGRSNACKNKPLKNLIKTTGLKFQATLQTSLRWAEK